MTIGKDFRDINPEFIVKYFRDDKKDKFLQEITLIIKHKEYKDLAAGWRGKVLNLSVELELSMDNFFARYFCNRPIRRRHEFITMILQSDGFMLGKKIKLCNRIFKNLRDIGEYKHERVKAYLESIQETRNIVAHSDINSTDFISNLANKTSVFKQLTKKSKEPLVLSSKTFDSFMGDCAYCIDFFDEWTKRLDKPLPYKTSA